MSDVKLRLGVATAFHANDQSDFLQYIARGILEGEHEHHLCLLFEGMYHNRFAI